MQHTPNPGTAFRLQIAPDQATPLPAWQHARTAALAALSQGSPVALLGPPGSGKTLMLQGLAQALRAAGQAVQPVARGDAADLLHGDAIPLVDEAGCMDAGALDALLARPAPFVLAALPEFGHRLQDLSRAVTVVRLLPLAPVDVARYVADRLAAAGQPRGLIEPEAVVALARHSGGLPRLVNVIAGSAMFLAQLDGSPRVGLAHVEEAASERAELIADLAPALIQEGTPPGDEPLPGTAMPEPSLPEPLMPELAAPEPAKPGAAGPAGARLMRRRAVMAGAAAAGLAGVLLGDRAFQGRAAPGAAKLPLQASPAPDAATDASPGTDEATTPHAQQGMAPVSSVPGESPARATRAAPARPAAAASVPRSASTLPGPGPALRPDAPMLFRGPILNETMGQAGQVTLMIRGTGTSRAVTARFSAYAGLIGTGDLAGQVSEGGRLVLSGQLMMGRNPFLCDLAGVIAGDRLTGTASFVRAGGGGGAHSSFTLTRA